PPTPRRLQADLEVRPRDAVEGPECAPGLRHHHRSDVPSACGREACGMSLETLNLRREGAVLFAEIAAPPMNLLGPALVRDLVSLIQSAEADDAINVLVLKSADPEHLRSPL